MIAFLNTTYCYGNPLFSLGALSLEKCYKCTPFNCRVSVPTLSRVEMNINKDLQRKADSQISDAERGGW